MAINFLAQPSVDELVVPEGVRYKEASPEINKKAEDLLRKALLQNPPDFGSLMPMDGKTVTSTGMYLALYALKDRRDDLKGLRPAQYRIPIGKDLTTKSDSYIAQQPPQVAALAKVLSEIIRLDPDFRIRKMLPEELAIVWYYIAWDIEEPIFVAEDKSHRFIFGFASPEGERLSWVEDLTNTCFKLGQEGGKAITRCLCPVVEAHGRRYDVSFRECKEPPDRGTPVAPYHDPISGQTYGGEWRLYGHEVGAPADDKSRTPARIVLLISGNAFADNIEAKTIAARTIADFAKRIRDVVDTFAATEKESYVLVVEVTLKPSEQADFKMASNYAGDQARIRASLARIYAGVAALGFPHTSEPVKFQVVFDIGPVRAAGKP